MRVLIVLLALTATTVMADADHLLLSEFCVTPTAGEFVEIYNPTASSISLDNVHLCDLYGDSSGVEYFYPQMAVGPLTQSSADFLVQFPSGYTIASYEYLVIALDGAAFQGEYGSDADFDIKGTGGGATPMILPTNGYIGSSAGLTNGDEVLMLFYFDDTVDSGGMCYDLDYAVWGDNLDRRIDKTGLTVPGGTYLDDTANTSQDPVGDGAHPYGETYQRIDMTEGTETLSGGNGLTGHDETSENLSSTWVAFDPTPGGEYTALQRSTWGAIKSVF